MSDDCIFCQIISGDAPSTKLYEDEHTLVIMDIFPWTKGHCLILSKEHAPTIFELSEATAASVLATAKKVMPAMKKGLAPDGFNLFQSNGSAAWQTVGHFHMHILPRYLDDGLVPPKIPGAGDREEIATAARAITEAM